MTMQLTYRHITNFTFPDDPGLKVGPLAPFVLDVKHHV